MCEFAGCVCSMRVLVNLIGWMPHLETNLTEIGLWIDALKITGFLVGTEGVGQTQEVGIG